LIKVNNNERKRKMNKTVKTIAWICLVLGLLGVTAEVGAYVYGRSRITQYKEAVEAGEIPAFKGHFADIDEDFDEEEWEEHFSDRGGWFAFGGMMSGGRGFDTFTKSSGRMSGMHGGSFGRVGFALPFLLLASAPVLTVVGAVMLIVNREPKSSDSKEKKEKSKKK